MNKKIALLLVLCGFTFNSANAYEQTIVNNYNGDPAFAFNIYTTGESFSVEGEKVKGVFDIPASYLNPLYISAKDWYEVLNEKPKNLIEYAVTSLNDYNAAAASIYIFAKGQDDQITWIDAAYNNLNLKNPKNAQKRSPSQGVIMLGYGVDDDHPGWQPYSGKHALYHSELSELNTVMEHEIMHSLGVSSNADQNRAAKGDRNYYFTDSDKQPLTIFDKYLRIYQGNTADVFNPAKEIVPNATMAVGKGKDFDVYTYSPYFAGEETLKVLSGKDNYDDARQAIIDNGGLKNYSISYEDPKIVYGMPIHPADDMKDPDADLSHLELRNSFMSHQQFRNWLIPMEAELAVLKDIGYKNIQLRKYFGKSYYLNGITDTYTAGFSEWDGTKYTGSPSSAEQAVGIHIYGDNNNITQASDILAKGEGSFGVRIDGVNNTYTLKSGNKINADGTENIALGVTWGKGHNINIEKGATITAKGEDGIAASFDFGTNFFGIYEDQMGSYMKYNSSFEYSGSPNAEANEALVENFDVSGTLEGKNAAIYISDNAHVKNINIKNGAQINGDIISKWNSVKSGYKSKIKIKKDGIWEDVNPENINEIYFTNLNFANDYNGTINGSISGENETFNTLKLNNEGDLTISGKEINVYNIKNNGTMNLSNTDDLVSIETQSGEILGNGELNLKQNVSVNVDANFIENTVNLAKNSNLSTINDEKGILTVNKINSNNGKISFDLGDEFVVQNASYGSQNKASIGQVKVDEKTAEQLDEKNSYQLFGNSNTLDLGSSKANVYYDKEKYTLSQDPNDSSRLTVKLTGKNVELGDAAKDETTANYIVTEDKLTKDAGTVKGDVFEITGKDINVNGHKGLVIDGNKNKDRTTIKTSIYGAKDSNLTVKNKGKLVVEGENKDINIGKKNEKAITIDDGQAVLYSQKNSININGSIQGKDPEKDYVAIAAPKTDLNEVKNIRLQTQNTNLNLKGTLDNTDLLTEKTILNVKKDAYLSSNGTNKLTLDNSAINLQNNKASDIKLAKLVLKSDISTKIDVDLESLNSDKFVLKNSKDFESNSFAININNINVINENAPLSDEKYEIPFASKKYHTESLIGCVNANVNQEFMSPIFKYKMTFENNKNMAGFVLSRGSSGDTSSYNPAIFAAPVAAQFGGYLSQLNSYDQAFNNLDMKMLMTREERQAYKMANLYASEARPLTYSPVYLPEKEKAGWFRPYTAFDKVRLSHGPKVRNIMYGSFFGFDTDMFESASGWDSQYSIYFGYNGSHQKYDGNSIYQNGGSMGASGIWYKGDFFTGLTANVGANVADATTMYGSEDFPMLMTGIASKTGYNWELARGKFIIQPSYLMSYSFVNTFDYTNAAGVKVSSDPLHAINITPGIKLIGNLKHGWQPYAGVQMVWNIMDKTHFKAQNVDLPEMSVKPYVQYGVGVQKRWGERFTGFFETTVRNAGRNGVAFNAGFRWTLGK